VVAVDNLTGQDTAGKQWWTTSDCNNPPSVTSKLSCFLRGR